MSDETICVFEKIVGWVNKNEGVKFNVSLLCEDEIRLLDGEELVEFFFGEIATRGEVKLIETYIDELVIRNGKGIYTIMAL